ncbi:MAG: acylneuraminate cytidylyltransferase family protein [Alphaproteobacteria bacterium]|jgi:CMP-N-acetylneuraminic acid synthetase|nr:acylneuraminate cytidylyltransferase family protein [Alphaproteobacteria bacterium]
MVNILAIIPARGGSQRIPGKNLALIAGKPLVEWTIKAAQDSGMCGRIHLSTDDVKIRAAAEKAGLPVPFLREQHADSHAPLVDVLLYELTRCEAYYGEQYDAILLLQATSPLRNALHIQQAVKQFEDTNAPSLISVHAFHGANPWWALTRDDSGTFQFAHPDKVKQRSQDLPHSYCPNGAIFMARRDVLEAQKTFYVPGAQAFILPWYAGFDIDEPEDLELINLLAQQYAPAPLARAS